MYTKPPYEYFSSTYREARERFLAACETQRAAVETLRHPLDGPDGESLHLDAARVGPTDAEALLVIVSGTHGPEGFCGSACQLRWLHENTLPSSGPTAVLLVHAHNPYGFAWGVRHTHERVDLNRNFVDHDAPPENGLAGEFFDELGDVSGMDVTEYIDRFLALRADYEEKFGKRETAGWLGYGQYRHEQGLHFGGYRPTWSSNALHDVLRRHGADAREVILIDIHTGLGRYGYGELLSLDSATSGSFARSRSIFGGTVHSMPDGRSAASYSVGNVSGAVAGILPAATVTAHALEFGTFEGPELAGLRLRYQHCLAAGAIESDDAAALRDEYRALFYPERPDWMELVLNRSAMVIRQAQDWLAEAAGASRPGLGGMYV